MSKITKPTEATNIKRQPAKGSTAHKETPAASVTKAREAEIPPSSNTPSVNSAPATKQRQTKAALLRASLAEPGGISLAALMKATDWQAHTIRAALSGLRKSGLIITRHREGADTIYAIGTAKAGDGAATENVGPRQTGDGLSDEPRDGAVGQVNAKAATTVTNDQGAA